MVHQSYNATVVLFADGLAHLWLILMAYYHKNLIREVLAFKIESRKSSYVDVRFMQPALWLYLCIFSSQDAVRYFVHGTG